MMLEEKIGRVRKLLEQRDRINAELAAIMGEGQLPKRGRPRKDGNSGHEALEEPAVAVSTSKNDSVAPESN